MPVGPKPWRVRKMAWSWCSECSGSSFCCTKAQRHTFSRLRDGLPLSMRLMDWGQKRIGCASGSLFTPHHSNTNISLHDLISQQNGYKLGPDESSFEDCVWLSIKQWCWGHSAAPFVLYILFAHLFIYLILPLGLFFLNERKQNEGKLKGLKFALNWRRHEKWAHFRVLPSHSRAWSSLQAPRWCAHPETHHGIFHSPATCDGKWVKEWPKRLDSIAWGLYSHMQK